MPLISKSSYQRRPPYLFNPHLETVVPSAFRKVRGVTYDRERVELEDGDFLDVDWLTGGSDKLVVLTHGLEGSSDRPYIAGMAKYFAANGWDALAWNCRTCGGEMNRLPRLYHHGATEDLSAVVEHGLKSGRYRKIALVGFSMGGSMSLKYLGERGSQIREEIIGAATFSVPCNLWDSAVQLTRRSNKFYKDRFLNKLKEKMKVKALRHPEVVNVTDIDLITTFDEFDDRYTAPLHGFSSRDDFYLKATSDQFYPELKRPALVANALNDPMLGEKCYPFEMARESSYLYLETPKVGGHVGFTQTGAEIYWAEMRALEFLEGIS
ncbi:MAG: alpha/beta fold hydrolase [Imperialibacter sp.]|uniref:YheT family hydrolase n=1 Tax=Imperialibacter sp. TaxID=2038411 RepID=UPI0032ED1479